MRTRMEFGVDVAKAFGSDVRVDFGGVDAGMAEEFLDDAEVGAIFEEVRGETVAEHVRGDIALNARETNAFLDVQPECDGRERRSALCKENVGGRTARDEVWAAGLEIALQRFDGLAPERHDAFFVAFSNYGDETAVEMKLFEAHAAEFGEAQATRVGEFEDGVIAEISGRGVRRRREKLLDLFGG